MKNVYEDLVHLPHPVSRTHPQMSMAERAAQFAPFAALTGYDDAVRETARQTRQRIELDEYEQAELNRRLQDAMQQHQMVRITYFAPDSKKSGGAYVSAVGSIRRIDTVEQLLILADRTRLPLLDVLQITPLEAGPEEE